MGSKPPSAAVAGIADMDADVVALQELTPAFSEAIAADPSLLTRYPYRILDPAPGPDGLGILSRLPLIERPGHPDDGSSTPACCSPTAGRWSCSTCTPPGRSTATSARSRSRSTPRRATQDVAAVRAAVDALDDPAAALVVGDLNGTSQEPGLESLRRGLVDAHEAVGIGPGFTWRPDALEPLGFGVLRIDHVLTGSMLRPVDTAVDCSAVGDHCRLLVLDVAAD